MTKVTSEVSLIFNILRSRCFEVPWHQRYYDWKGEQVGELLSDLKDAFENDKSCYFLGSIMLARTSVGKLLRINDGQQRLITLSLIVAAFCRRFARKHPRDKNREILALQALFDLPSNVTSQLRQASKYQLRIEPPKNDRAQYVQIVRGYDIGTNGLLTSAWSIIKIYVDAMSKADAAKFFDFLIQRVEVSVLNIPSDVDANSVFEALNARGKSLDDVDLIRNRLYSHFSEAEDSVRRETVHENLERTIVIGRNQKTVQEYFRCYLQCRYGYLQKTRFYRETRKNIEREILSRNSADYVFRLVEGLGNQENIELFRTITSSRANPNLDKHLPRIFGKRSLTVLLAELKGYKVSHPLVFALLHRVISERKSDTKRQIGKAATRSLKNLASFVMRTAFVAPKFEPSNFEAAFANLAKNVFDGKDLLSLDILDDLKANDEFGIVSDSDFIRRMTEIEFLDLKRARRYLFGINARNQMGSDALQEEKCSVEHVLPQSETHWKGWSGFKGIDPDKWVRRAGNLLIVSIRENQSGPGYNRNYAAKRRVFKESALQMSCDVAETYKEWNIEVVKRRSEKLAKEAAKTWQFM